MVEDRNIKRVLKKTNYRIKNPRKKLPEFKFSKDTLDTKNRFLKLIKNMNVDMGVLCIDKYSINIELQNKSESIYKKIIVKTVIDAIKNHYDSQHCCSIKIIIDKSLQNPDIVKFNQYCEEKIRSYMANSHTVDCKVTINHVDSKIVKMIQVTDYLAGSIQRKFERNDSRFFDIIKVKIKHFRKIDENNRIDW